MGTRGQFTVRREALREVEIDVVRVTGDVDLAEAAELSALLSERTGAVVVDLRDCTFIGSDGLRALLEGRGLATERGDRFVLAVTPATAPARLLDVVLGETIFNVQATLYEALTTASARDRRVAPDRRRAAA